MNTQETKKIEVTPPQLAGLGAGSLGYIREIDSGLAVKLLGRDQRARRHPALLPLWRRRNAGFDFGKLGGRFRQCPRA